MPFISVIIPVYNKEPHLDRCLNSVFNQTFKDYEVIIVDDSSTDGSYPLLEELVKDRQNCLLFKRNKPGPGGYAARNLGIKKASSPWMAFLDADDEWFPDLLKIYKELVDSNENCLFFATAQKRVSSGGKETLDPYSEAYKKDGNVRFSLLDYSREGALGRNPIQTSAVLAKKSLLLELDGFPEGRCKRGGDRDLWLRLLIKTDLLWSPYIGAVYYRDSVNMVTKNMNPQLCSCMDQTYSHILNDKGLKQRFGKRLIYYIKRQSNYEKKSAIKKLFISGTLKPDQLKYLFFTVEPLYYCKTFFLSLLSGKTQKLLITIYRKCKGR